MTDPASLALLDVLTKLVPAALFTDANLYCLATCKAVRISLERGYSDGSCPQFEWLGLIAGTRFGDHKAGFRSVKLATLSLNRVGCSVLKPGLTCYSQLT